MGTASPAESGRTCTTCRHEPAWVKCLSTDTWLHGLCARTGFGLNKRRRYCYSWDARIVDCPKWEAKTVTGKQRSSSQRNATNKAVSRPVATNGRKRRTKSHPQILTGLKIGDRNDAKRPLATTGDDQRLLTTKKAQKT